MVAPGDGGADALAAGLGDGVATNGSFNAPSSELLITKVPSRSSVRTNHMPSPADAPTMSLCTALSSGDVVKVTVSCGLSTPCAAFVAPAQRTARSAVNVFRSDWTFVVLIGSFPFAQVHSFYSFRTSAYSLSVVTESR